jgi:hypothetical protein
MRLAITTSALWIKRKEYETRKLNDSQPPPLSPSRYVGAKKAGWDVLQDKLFGISNLDVMGIPD